MIRRGVRDAEICDDTRKCDVRKCVGSSRLAEVGSGGLQEGWYPLGPVHTVDNALNA